MQNTQTMEAPVVDRNDATHASREAVKTLSRPALRQTPRLKAVHPENETDFLHFDEPSTHPGWLAGTAAFGELSVSFDPVQRAVWQEMAPKGRPSFTEGMLNEMLETLDMVEWSFAATHAGAKGAPPVRYVVLASAMPGIFNLGGDLALFHDLIVAGDRPRLRAYAHLCAHIQYRFGTDLDRPLTTIALVQGDALAGGFEAALAQDVIIAERSAKFGLPEVLFNLFAGMGAYSFLSRRLDPARAERLILSGRRYDAEELAELGVVDRVVDDGTGRDAVADYIVEADRKWNARQAVQRVRRRLQPLTLEEMIEVVDIWVEAALALEPTDLRKMKHLAKAQDRLWSTSPR